MLESFQDTGQSRTIGEIHPRQLPTAIQAGIMVRGDHRGREALNQLKIPLLTGNNQKPVQRQRPAQGEKTNGLASGCPERKHIQKPMTTKSRSRDLMLLP